MNIFFTTILAFCGSAAPAILFNINRNKILWVGIAGALGWLTYNIILFFNPSVIIATFFGTIIVNTYSEVMARIKKAPALMFYIPALFPLVPGFLAYDTLLNVIQKNYSVAFSQGLKTAGVALSICFGLMISSAIMRFVFDLIKKKKLKKGVLKMKYCNKCKKIYNDNINSCTCGADIISDPDIKENDPVYLTTRSGFDRERIEAALSDNSIPFENRTPKKSSGSLSVISGTATGDIDIYVPYGMLDKATEVMIGVCPNDYSEEEIEQNTNALENNNKEYEFEEMSNKKRIFVRIISIIMFLLLVWAIVTATDFATGWLKGLFW